MNHRTILIGSTAFLMAAFVLSLNAQYDTGSKEEVKLEGGWQYKDLQYEKHIPEVTVRWEGEIAVIYAEVKHPQTAEHHISAFRIYDENRIEIAESKLDPELSQPKTVFYLKLGPGATIYIISDCNIHGIWMKKLTL